MSQTIFITGASSGLGEAAVNIFAKNGWTVFATMRNPEQHTSFSKLANVHLLKLDVDDVGQIAKVVAEAERISPIDVLFNNAGYALAGPLEGMSDEQLEQQISTNFLGTLRLTRACLPGFRSRNAGIIINTTSLGAYIPNPMLAVYGATKAALESWTEGMYFELASFGIVMKTIIPGLMNTNFSQSAQLAAHPAYQDQVEKVLAAFSSAEATLSADNPVDVAAIVFEAATDNKKQLHYFAGKDATTKSAWLEQEGKDAVISATEKLFFG
ncbi:SDR family oxidoreductase [Sphingobacterium sp. JB170]|uniref:SDR family oxidoreductase n=1 Tax=Sphingobacterium sp. JB170 TaxID=1434842 RepID=UPI00097E8418|nr:SDR family oxidoreductase [Sphingobacterium sp. JB170]SJN45840.1 3-oxoacyl-[acyl-carrier protein] reductase [Sphingobacterium sp. JB170]